MSPAKLTEKCFRRTPLLAALAAALLAGCSGGPVPLYESREPAPENFTYAEVPLKVRDGWAFVRLETQGKEIELFLDTGANLVTFAPLPEEVQGLQRKELPGEYGLATSKGYTRYRKYVLPEVRLGGLTYRGLVCDVGHNMPGGMRKGHMGLALLREFDALIDYKDGKLGLYRRGLRPAGDDLSGWQRIPFRLEQDLIVLKGRFREGGGELTFVLDTGGRGVSSTGETANVMKGSSLGRAGALPFSQEGGGKVLRGLELLLEGEPVGPLNFVFSDGFTKPLWDEGGLLGNDFFGRYKVFIDFGGSQLYIRRHE